MSQYHSTRMSSTNELEDYLLAVTLSLELLDGGVPFGNAQQNSDFTLASKIMKDDLEKEINSYNLAKSIAKAVSTDSETIRLFQQREEMEANDRQIALGRRTPDLTSTTVSTNPALIRTNATTRPTNPLFAISNSPESKITTLENSLKSLNLSDKTRLTNNNERVPGFGENLSGNHSFSRPSGLFSPPAPRLQNVECASCFEEFKFDKGTLLNCNHFYCRACLITLANASLKDRTLIPLRCCKVEIPVHVVKSSFSRSDFERYQSFWDEVKNPNYAATKLDNALEILAVDNGWKRCPKCKIVIDRWTGCVHMTCICRHQFCHQCLKTWRTCTCELFTPREVDRMLNERLAPHEVNQPAARERLRGIINNQYNHIHGWMFRHGTAMCQSCNWTMPRFYFCCSTCREIRCGRCKNNRE